MYKTKFNLQGLNVCIRCGCISKFLKFKLDNHSFQYTSLYKSWQRKLLQLEIDDEQNTLYNHRHQSTNLLLDLRNQVPFLDFIALLSLIRNNNVSGIKQTPNRREKKLNAIGGTSHAHQCDPDKLICNLLNRILIVRKKLLFWF